MTEIVLLHHPCKCDENKRLPDSKGKPSGYTTDESWCKALAIDVNINLYDVYWSPGADTNKAPTAVISGGKDVVKNIIIPK